MSPARITGHGPSVIAAWRIPARDPRSPHGSYDVALVRGDEKTKPHWRCECLAYEFNGSPCKHIQACRALYRQERRG